MKIKILLLLVYLAFFSTREVQAVTINGKITFNGMPVSGVAVYASENAGMAYTRRDGTYSLRIKTAGTYLLSPLPRRAYFPQPFSRSVAVSTADVQSVDFTLLSPGTDKGIVSGRITDYRWRPVEGVLVRTTGGYTTTTDKNGLYFFTALPVGRYFVIPSRDEFTFSQPLAEFKVRAAQRSWANFRMIPQKQGENYPTYFTGIWKISTSVTNSNCPFTIPSIDGFTLLYQKRTALSIKLQRYGTLRSVVEGHSFATKVKMNRFWCRITGDVKGAFSNRSSATVRGSLAVSCFNSNPCSLEFEGQMTRDL